MTSSVKQVVPFVKANGIHMHYLQDGAGPNLTILGGLGDSARNWGLLARRLAKNFRVLILDHRGVGQSEKAKPPYSISQFAKDTIGVFHALEISQSHVLGFSMGGMVALQMVLDFPNFVDKLVLVSTSPSKKMFPPDKIVRKILKNYTHDEGHYAQTYKLLFSEKFRKNYPLNSFSRFKISDPHPQPKENFLAQYEAVINFDICDHLNKIKNKTLIIAGSADVITPPQAAQYLHKNIPNSHLDFYKGCQHIPQAEEPKRFLQDVIQFLI